MTDHPEPRASTFDADRAGFRRLDTFDPAAEGTWFLLTESGSHYTLQIDDTGARLLREPRHGWLYWVDDATGQTINLDGQWNTVTEIVEIATGARASFWVDTHQPEMKPRTLRSTPVTEIYFRPGPGTHPIDGPDL